MFARSRSNCCSASPGPIEHFSLAAMIRGMAIEKLPGYEGRVLRAAAENAAENFDPQRVRLPWQLLGRDLAVGTDTAGGFLASSFDAVSPRDILRNFSIAADAGISIIPGLKANAVIPTTAAAPVPTVLSDEQTEISVSTAVTLGQAQLGPPKNFGVSEIQSSTFETVGAHRAVYPKDFARLDRSIFGSASFHGRRHLPSCSG